MIVAKEDMKPGCPRVTWEFGRWTRCSFGTSGCGRHGKFETVDESDPPPTEIKPGMFIARANDRGIWEFVIGFNVYGDLVTIDEDQTVSVWGEPWQWIPYEGNHPDVLPPNPPPLTIPDPPEGDS